MAPIFKNQSDWETGESCALALISGFMAKRERGIYSEVLFGGNIACIHSVGSSIPLLVFSLLYTLCVAAIASIKREMGKMAVGVVVWQCVIAWVAVTDRTSDRDDLILLIAYRKNRDGFDCFQSSPSVFFQFLNWRGFYLISLVLCPPWDHWTSGSSWLRSSFQHNIRNNFPLNFQFDGDDLIF